jgi:hypothetical protein
MRQATLLALPALLGALNLSAPSASAGDRVPVRQLVASEGTAHPCTFYRGQAYRMGVTHYATEMLWACEEIATRRAAEMPLSDRLLATEHALLAYREALAAARNGPGEGRSHLSMSDARKREIAETTGVLAALEAISGGF